MAEEEEAIGLSFSPLGDCALLLELDSRTGPDTVATVRALAEYLEAQSLPGVRDLVPALSSIGIHYDPERWQDKQGRYSPYEMIVAQLQRVLPDLASLEATPGRLVEVPVCYEPEYGEDLESLASSRELSVAELVEIHTATSYTVCMVGFAPGFVYLGTLDERLQVPRRTTPRARVPAGSVAVANQYTGIYPSVLPGGWHLIGRTPIRLFDVKREQPSMVSAGDRVRFVSITAGEYRRLRGDV